MATTHKPCSKRVFSGERWDVGGHMCGTPATIESGGKWYCKRHTPEGIADANAKREARWQEIRRVERRKYDILDAKDAVVKVARDWAHKKTTNERLFAAVAALERLEASR